KVISGGDNPYDIHDAKLSSSATAHESSSVTAHEISNSNVTISQNIPAALVFFRHGLFKMCRGNEMQSLPTGETGRGIAW
ncbi:hypothetical protein ACTQ28_10205, partial [Bacillota bacterium LCP21S3_A4]